MTTTLSPALGHAPLFTQAGVGASPGYDMVDLRRAFSPPMQEGVMAAQSFEVTQRAAGANMSVDIAASTIDAAAGVGALVQGDAVTAQGLYPVPAHTAVINEVITTANATLPRIDRVILELQDTTHDGSGGNLVRTRVVAGTATSGATLTNLTGAAAVPNSALLLADVLVGAGVTTIPNSVIRDRRKWARGALVRIPRSTANYTTSSTSLAEIDATNLKPRIECSGVPLRVVLDCDVTSASASKAIKFDLFQDGVTASVPKFDTTSALLTSATRVSLTWVIIPSAGSHQIAPAFASVDGTTMTVGASAGNPLIFTVEEIVRQNYANNTVTSG